MTDPITDERLREMANGATIYGHERNAIAAELLAARERIAKLEQEPPMAMIDFGYGLDLQGIRDDLKFLDDVRRENRQLRAEVERLREDANTTAMDLVDERDAARADLREAVKLIRLTCSGYESPEWKEQAAELLDRHKETP